MLKSTTTRRPTFRRCSTIILAALVGLGTNRWVSAEPYTVTNIAASVPGSTYEESFQPAIGNNGTIAYLGNPAPGVNEGVYRYQSGSASLVAPASVTGGIYGYGGLSVNDAGTIAFEDFNVIYSVTGTTIATLAAPDTGAGIGATYPSIASDGSVVFALRNLFDSVTVRTASGATTHDIAFSASSTVVQEYAGFNVPGQVPMMSGNGNAAYLWVGPDGTTPELDLYHGGTSTVITSLAPFGLHYFNVNNDSVAIFGQPAGKDLGVYVGDGTELDPVTLPTGLLPVGPLSFNNLGTIAFMGNPSGSTVGIWTTESSQPVVQIGDPLDGSTITGINFGPHGLNDSGQIVFSAYLASGHSGVYLLSPVPEPSTLLLALCAAVCLATMTVLRHRRPRP